MDPTPPPTTQVPQKTVTATVTVPPKPPATTPVQPPPTAPVQPPPTSAAVVPPPGRRPAAERGPGGQVSSFQETPTIPTATPPPTDIPTAEETPPPASELYEIRNAGSEFDGATLSHQLGIPALILVLMVLFAVLIFEGGLRRQAHAAPSAGRSPGV